MQHTERLVAKAQTEEWFNARRYGISATAVANASTPAGFRDEVAKAVYPEDNIVHDNAYMAFGREHEQWIVENLPEEYGLQPNDWLIRSEDNPWFLATPDALNDDWSVIGEVKTTGKDWVTPPMRYIRQIQWQLYVTGAEKCILGWLLRAEDHQGDFVPGWFEPKWMEIHRADVMIKELIKTANRLVEEINNQCEERDKLHG